ncbi:uncharacterized protein LACBIDRAFT_296794 [Laccaria bicolor S238N-H82]|uniref:Predicted protein n=1 Tax=Laccaria bicolor (strain S238N-H82 / ATCC MYA-4686) TaxID=486041 RepID=B0E343_LACBS|nr:uncharacterized protein LACBIDRAFT_296794 [Laccaria bicolor S238N-H82]EDQ98731.1 predicted protein [Laccaria bicolor S238N-H82]|eukprot:XP_001890608.1 predicted protein [Laccaria bicolor S238N-H82]
MISAASAQIETVGGQHLTTTIVKDGKKIIVPDYAKVQGIFIGAVAAFVVFITIIGPEYDSYSIVLSVCLPRYRKHGSDFEQPAFERGGVREESLRAPKHVISLNTDDDIELEKARAY